VIQRWAVSVFARCWLHLPCEPNGKFGSVSGLGWWIFAHVMQVEPYFYIFFSWREPDLHWSVTHLIDSSYWEYFTNSYNLERQREGTISTFRHFIFWCIWWLCHFQMLLVVLWWSHTFFFPSCRM
jgi:hypothetical protein